MADPGPKGRFGRFGGRFVPEALVPACLELEAAFRAAWSSQAFRDRYADLLRDYAGRPTPVTECHRLSDQLGIRILLKREDLTHTGSHKINNVLGQGLLTLEMGKTRMLAETGAGQHGVATATAAALFGLECVVYMGEVDTERQALNVFRMRLLGAEVYPVRSGSRTLKDAVNEALRDWVATVDNTHYCLGSVMGPHPYPWMVREFQRVVGDEARQQCEALLGGEVPDMVVACVGGGSNAAGTFAGFVDTPALLIGVEAAGGSAVGRGFPGCCTACTPTCCRMSGARSSKPSPSPPASITRASGRSTRICTISGGPPTAPLPTTRCWPRSSCCRVPKGSFPPSSPPTLWPGWYGRSAPERWLPGSTALITLSGRGDKDAEQVMRVLG